MDYQAFKFRALNDNFFNSLQTNSIWFATPETLNDPFDCNVAVMKAVRSAMERTTGAKKVDLLRLLNAGPLHGLEDIFAHFNATTKNKLGIFSLSHDTCNPLLWTHYAEEHRGVCLIYHFTNEFVWNPNHKIMAFPFVKYSLEPLIDFFMNGFFNTANAKDLLLDVSKITITLKSPEWSYEKEVRMVRDGGGALIIPRDSLYGLIFGLKTPEDKKNHVINFLKENGYNLKLFEAIEHPAEHGIAITEYN